MTTISEQPTNNANLNVYGQPCRINEMVTLFGRLFEGDPARYPDHEDKAQCQFCHQTVNTTIGPSSRGQVTCDDCVEDRFPDGTPRP